MGIPSTIPQGCLLRAGQELPTLGFPSLPQPSQSLPGSVTLHWGRLSACREPPGTEEPASVHSPAVCLRWEHFLGDGAGSMLARQPGHPLLLLLPSHELPATDRGAPQHTAVCCRYAVLAQSKVPRPQPWGAQRAAERSCFGKGQAILLAAVWWLRAAFVQWRFSQPGGLRTSAQGGWVAADSTCVGVHHPGHPAASPHTYPRAGPTHFIKRKAQRIIRKETQSTTIQIMRYVLLGCKVTSQALSTTGSTVLPAAQQGLQGHAATPAQHSAKPTLHAAAGPDSPLAPGRFAPGQRFCLPATRWGVSSPSAPGRHWW